MTVNDDWPSFLRCIWLASVARGRSHLTSHCRHRLYRIHCGTYDERTEPRRVRTDCSARDSASQGTRVRRIDSRRDFTAHESGACVRRALHNLGSVGAEGISEIPHRRANAPARRSRQTLLRGHGVRSNRHHSCTARIPNMLHGLSSPEIRLRRSFAEDLLALFTTRDRSESIVGDLIEQRDAHGRGWFACEVARLAFALCIKSLVAAPLRALCLAALGWVVYAGALVLLSIASRITFVSLASECHEPGFWLRLGLIVFGANLITGGVLARWASRSGSAIAPLLTLWLVGWVVFTLLDRARR